MAEAQVAVPPLARVLPVPFKMHLQQINATLFVRAAVDAPVVDLRRAVTAVARRVSGAVTSYLPCPVSGVQLCHHYEMQRWFQFTGKVLRFVLT